MLNEVQKRMRVGRFVNYAILFTVLVGLTFLILGLRLITKDIPMPEDQYSPKITAPKHYSILRGSKGSVEAKPEPVYFTVDGKEVSGMASDVSAPAAQPSENGSRSGGSVTIQ